MKIKPEERREIGVHLWRLRGPEEDEEPEHEDEAQQRGPNCRRQNDAVLAPAIEQLVPSQNGAVSLK